MISYRKKLNRTIKIKEGSVNFSTWSHLCYLNKIFFRLTYGGLRSNGKCNEFQTFCDADINVLYLVQISGMCGSLHSRCSCSYTPILTVSHINYIQSFESMEQLSSWDSNIIQLINSVVLKTPFNISRNERSDSLIDRSLHDTQETHEHPSPQIDSNPRSQQESKHKPKPLCLKYKKVWNFTAPKHSN